MAFISLNNRKRMGDKDGVSIENLKSAIHGGSMYSAESADVLKAIKEGSFEAVDLSSIAQSIAPSLGESMDKIKNPQGLAMASMIASIAARPSDYMQMLTTESKMTGGVPVAFAGGMEYDNAYSAESFDNQNLIENLGISIGLTYKTARQGPAMEMIYRTIALTPDQGGYDIEVPNLFVMNTVQHADDGSESDFGLRRVIDSAIDYTVLNDNAVALLPVRNTATQANFVATSVVTPFQYTEGKRTVTTSALLPGKNINLFNLGQADQISRVGKPDYSEALDRNVGIKTIFMTLGANTLSFDVKGLPYSRFVKTPEQNGRGLKLDFPLTSIIIDKDTKDYAGAALSETVFSTIASGNYKVRLRTVVNGTVDVERGVININPGVIEVMSITNEAGATISLTTGAGATIVSGLAGLTTSGWWPDARLTNSNHRHLGLMLNVRTVKERLLTRVRSPFFVPYPLGEDRDQTIMDWLTFSVGAYINNEAVTSLIDYHERLMRLTGGLRGELTMGDFELNSMPIEGIARHMLNPYIQTLDVNLLDDTQSLTTVGNIENGQEVLLNTLRSVAFDILQRSNYENACRYLDGGEITSQWKIALVTSKKIERFMTVKGDSRTLGAGLPYQLESDVDARFDGVMYMTLVREGEGLDVLSSGVMLLTPTLVSTISVTRDNAPRNEAVFQPRFQHYNLLPIIVKINVAGVDELLEETLKFHVEGLVTPEEPVTP